MKIFTWERVSNATDNYHSGGGVMVVAENIEHAMALAEEQGVVFFSEYDSPCIEYDLLGDYEPNVIIFPDAGCC